MDEKKISYFLPLGIILILALGLFFQFGSRSGHSKILSRINNITQSNFKIEDPFLVQNTLILTDTMNFKNSIDRVLNCSPKLVLRFSDYNCMTCVKSVLSIIKSTESELKPFELLFFISNKGGNSTILLCRDENIHYPIYNVPYGSMSSQVEDYNVPYFFILYPNYIASFTFIPDEREPNLTIEYLYFATRLLNNKL